MIKRSLIPCCLFLSLLLVAVSCGDAEGADGGLDGQIDAMTDEEFFGIVPGTCVGLQDSAGVEVIVQAELGERPVDGREVITLTYRVNGTMGRVDHVFVEDRELRVARRQDYGSAYRDVVFEPPYLVSMRPIEPTRGSPLRTTTTAELLVPPGEDEWEVSVTIDDQEERLVDGLEEAVRVYPHFLSFAPKSGGAQADSFELVPGVGFVKIDLHDSAFPVADFVAVWESETPCAAIPHQ